MVNFLAVIASIIVLFIFIIIKFFRIAFKPNFWNFIFKGSFFSKQNIKIIFIFSIVLLEIFIILRGSICFDTGNRYYSASILKKGVSHLNQVLTLHKSLTDGKIYYDNIIDFTNIFLKRMTIVDARYINAPDVKNYNTGHPILYQEYSKNQIKKFNLKEYVGKPSFSTTESITFFIKKFQNGCKKIDRDNISNNDCLIDIDANSYKFKPNKMTETDKKPQDRITVIINGNNDTIVPPTIFESLIFN